MRVNQNLNGIWKFQTDPQEIGDTNRWYKTGLLDSCQVEVPHIWQTEKKYVNYCGTAWYEKEFEVAELSSDKDLFVCFAAVDFHAMVWINDVYIGEHEGGFTPFEFNMTDFIHILGKNRLVVRVYDPSDNAEIPIGKQGSWYTRISGIWQDVCLEYRSKQYIKHLFVYPDIDHKSIEIELNLSTSINQNVVAEYTVTNHEEPTVKHLVQTEVIRADKQRTVLSFDNITLWSPQTPHLYDVTVMIKKNGVVIDEYSTYFGMRKIEYLNGTLLLNNQPLYIRGTLDQSYYPKTIYRAPTDEWIKNEISMAKKMGFNLLRKHIKAEIPRYLYWADRLGILIWGEPPNVIKWSEQSKKRFYNELLGMIERDFNHPSIIIWSLYNEEWGLEWDLANDKKKQAYVKQMYENIKKLDPTRLICDNSGWIHVQTDINDYHRYFSVPEQIDEWESDLDEYIIENTSKNFVDGVQEQGQPIIVSEFGVWGLPSIKKLISYYEGTPPWFENLGDDTHREDFKMPINAFKNFDKYQLKRIFGDFENLAEHSQKRMYRAVKSLIEEMRKRPQINGYVVTEFTDVEWETNGWLDYTRNLKSGFGKAKNFNGNLVVMVNHLNRNLWCGEKQSVGIVIANDDMLSIQGSVIKWEISGTNLSGEINLTEESGYLIKVHDAIQFTAPVVSSSSFYKLTLKMYKDSVLIAENEEELTITPKKTMLPIKVFPYKMSDELQSHFSESGLQIIDDFKSADLVVTNELDKDVLDFYRTGGHVVFLAEEGDKLKEKGQFTFRELPRGEDWNRTSSFNYVDVSYFPNSPLHYEMGWEVESLYPDYIVPFDNYNKLGGTLGRIVYMFGNENITESSEIVSGYFQGWIGHAGGSILVKTNSKGSLTLITWKLLRNYGKHPIATQVLNDLIIKTQNTIL